jgi:RES domain-containing protein
LSIIVWRIVKKQYAEGMFNGVGAAKFGGRWNSKGTPMAYTSQHLSLATLELLVHLAPQDIGTSFVCASAEISEDIQIETIDPQICQRSAAELKTFGDRWVESNRSLVLCVPSAIIPTENNYLFNPNNFDFDRIIFNPPQEFKLDSRFIKLG